jgi:hypothetical protein
MEQEPTAHQPAITTLAVPLLRHIASFVGPSLTAVCLRPTCRYFAAALSDFTSVPSADDLLSAQLLHHLLEQHGLADQLSLRQRRSLMCKVAAAGDVQLLQSLVTGPSGSIEEVGLLGCTPDKHVFAAAAGAGQRTACELLYDLGCAWGVPVASAAIRGGHDALFSWLRSKGCPITEAQEWEFYYYHGAMDALAEAGRQAFPVSCL